MVYRDVPLFAKVEWLFPRAVDVTTQMRRLSWINTLDALQSFSHWIDVSTAPYI